MREREREMGYRVGMREEEEERKRKKQKLIRRSKSMDLRGAYLLEARHLVAPVSYCGGGTAITSSFFRRQRRLFNEPTTEVFL